MRANENHTSYKPLILSHMYNHLTVCKQMIPD